MQSIREKFKKWKKGKFIQKYPDEPEMLGGLGVIREGEWKEPLIIRIWNVSSGFYLKYWQWIIGIMVAFALKAF